MQQFFNCVIPQGKSRNSEKSSPIELEKVCREITDGLQMSFQRPDLAKLFKQLNSSDDEVSVVSGELSSTKKRKAMSTLTTPVTGKIRVVDAVDSVPSTSNDEEIDAYYFTARSSDPILDTDV